MVWRSCRPKGQGSADLTGLTGWNCILVVQKDLRHLSVHCQVESWTFDLFVKVLPFNTIKLQYQVLGFNGTLPELYAEQGHILSISIHEIHPIRNFVATTINNFPVLLIPSFETFVQALNICLRDFLASPAAAVAVWSDHWWLVYYWGWQLPYTWLLTRVVGSHGMTAVPTMVCSTTPHWPHKHWSPELEMPGFTDILLNRWKTTI